MNKRSNPLPTSVERPPPPKEQPPMRSPNVMVSGVCAITTVELSPISGSKVSSYKSKKDLAKQMLRQLILDWGSPSCCDETTAHEFHSYIDCLIAEAAEIADMEQDID